MNNTGLITSSSKFGRVEYKGVEYDIYVPNHFETTIGPVWTTVETQTVHDFNFDMFKFIAGIEFHAQEGGVIVSGDFKGEVNKSVLCNPKMKTAIGIAGIFAGILDSAVASSNIIFVEFIFQETTDNRKRVIIKAGSSNIATAYDNTVSNIPISAYYSNAGNPFGQAVISSSVAELYEAVTGNESNLLATYDCEITIDEQHRKNRGVASYLWVNKNGEITETPVIYPKDKVEFGVREGIGPFSILNPFYQVLLGGSSIASYEYQKLFHKLG